MYEISLMSQSDLKEAYEIEKTTNPTPWSKENFSLHSKLVTNH